MSHRIEKVNKHIHRTFGDILQKEADIPEGAMVTISRVETAQNLQSCTVWIYISPLERESKVMDQLKGQMYDLQGSLNRKLYMHPLPRIKLRIDHGLVHAETVNKKLHELKHNIAN